MKTFVDFLLEANVSAASAELRRRANVARQKGDMETFIELQKQASELGAGTQAKIKVALNDKPQEPANRNSKVVGYASKAKDTRARGGSLPNIPSSDGEAGGSIVSGRQGDTRTGKSGGVKGTLRNRGISRTGSTIGTSGNS